MQAAEIRHAGRRTHAAQETVTLDQKRSAALSTGRRSRGNAGGPAAQNDNLELAENRRIADRLGDAGQQGASSIAAL
jgi:hypothetical protein